jgi:hypothetical protein
MVIALFIFAVIAAVSHLLNIAEKTHHYGPAVIARSFSQIVMVSRIAYQVILFLIYASLVLCTMHVRQPF